MMRKASQVPTETGNLLLLTSANHRFGTFTSKCMHVKLSSLHEVSKDFNHLVLIKQLNTGIYKVFYQSAYPASM